MLGFLFMDFLLLFLWGLENTEYAYISRVQ